MLAPVQSPGGALGATRGSSDYRWQSPATAKAKIGNGPSAWRWQLHAHSRSHNARYGLEEFYQKIHKNRGIGGRPGALARQSAAAIE